jgi:hypothetical protein
MSNQQLALAVAPKSFEDLHKFAVMVSKTKMVPVGYQGKPDEIFVGIQWGLELGLKPLQALQNIAVINGKPSIYGDAMLALVRNSDHCEYVVEEFDKANMTAVCKTKRKGQPEQVTTFSVDQAKVAKLWGKQGPWSQYPERMLQFRARGFALRDMFPDVLQGLISREEAMDYPEEREVQATVYEKPQAQVEAPVLTESPANQDQIDGFLAKCAENEIELDGGLIADIESKTVSYVRLKEEWRKIQKSIDGEV